MSGHIRYALSKNRHGKYSSERLTIHHKFEISDISDESNPIKIATPRLIVLAGSDAEISMGELKKQFIEIKAFVSKETGEGTAEVSIIQNEKRASAKLTTRAGQPAKLLTGAFAIQFIFKEAKIDQ